ncbi:MAG: protein kinase, partial [Planctomycetaceae bacterium]|nr:protein kinase [Planctomycetaceae bacterium]
RLDRAWRQGDQPSIEALAAGVETQIRPALLQRLAEQDIVCRLRARVDVRLDDYLVRWPNLDRVPLAKLLVEAEEPLSNLMFHAIPAVERPPASCSRSDLLARLQSSQLLSAEEMEQVTREFESSEGSTEQLCAALKTNWRVTDYQLQWLLNPSPDPLVLGEYLILDRVGQGGMGSVYRAMHRRMKRQVAIKMLRRDIANADALSKRFLREIEVAARLRHPNIVTAYDAGESHGISFLVSEYVDGQNLADLVHDYGPLSIPLAVDIILQSARALACAHAEGIIHRDVKPSNLLLDNDGNVKLLDVGLARVNSADGTESDSQRDLTTTGVMMGTVDYMSPEQALNTRMADERSDLYSLGCTLFFLLTGRSPFGRGTAMERLIAHREAAIPLLSELWDQFPKSLDDLLSCMMAKNPANRPPTAAELIQYLEHLQATGLPDMTHQLIADDDEVTCVPTIHSDTAATQPEAAIQSRVTIPMHAPSGSPIPGAAGVLAPTVAATRSKTLQPVRSEAAVNDSDQHRSAAGRSTGGHRLLWSLASLAMVAGLSALYLRPLLQSFSSSREAISGDSRVSTGPAQGELSVSPDRIGGTQQNGAGPLEENLPLLADNTLQQVTTWQNQAALDLGIPVRYQLADLEFVFIPPGQFYFGESDGEQRRSIPQGFYLSTTEITVSQFREFDRAVESFRTEAEIHHNGWGVDAASGQWRNTGNYFYGDLGGNFVHEQTP